MFEPRFPAAITQHHINKVVRELCREINRAERFMCIAILKMNGHTEQLARMLASGKTMDAKLSDVAAYASDILFAMSRREIAYDLLAQTLGREEYIKFMDEYPSRIRTDD